MNSQSLLDEMVNEDSVRILKAAIPYLPSKGQSFICIFAKFLELQNTFKLLHSSENAMQICAKPQEKTDPLEMLSACSKVCHGPLKEKLENITNTFLITVNTSRTGNIWRILSKIWTMSIEKTGQPNRLAISGNKKRGGCTKSNLLMDG